MNRTPTAEQWPPELPVEKDVADAMEIIFAKTCDHLLGTRKEHQEQLVRTSIDRLLLHIVDSADPAKPPLLFHAIDISDGEEPQKVDVPATVTANVLNQLQKNHLQSLGSLLCYEHAVREWEQQVVHQRHSTTRQRQCKQRETATLADEQDCCIDWIHDLLIKRVRLRALYSAIISKQLTDAHIYTQSKD